MGLVALARRLGFAPKAKIPKIPLWQKPLKQAKTTTENPPDPATKPTNPTAAGSSETVWLFTGCVMDATMRDVHSATQKAVEASGGQVVFPGPDAACCGALHRHAGLRKQAQKLASNTINSMPDSAPILVNSAGCGAAMKDYGNLLGTPQAKSFSSRVRDIHEWLADKTPLQTSPEQKASDKQKPKVAVLDPCHLRHVQKTHQHVRQVLQPYAEIVELDDDGICCGAGGVYSLTHPEAAAAISQRKQAAILRSQAQIVVAANPGCVMHLAEDLKSEGVRICHPMELLQELA